MLYRTILLLSRRYTRFFTSNDHRAADLSEYALQNVKKWEKAIDQWQSPILNNELEILLILISLA